MMIFCLAGAQQGAKVELTMPQAADSGNCAH
jgi:hypothetical protein